MFLVYARVFICSSLFASKILQNTKIIMYCNNNRLSLLSRLRFALRVSSLFMRSYQQTNFKIKTVLTDPYGRKSDRKNKERKQNISVCNLCCCDPGPTKVTADLHWFFAVVLPSPVFLYQQATQECFLRIIIDRKK